MSPASLFLHSNSAGTMKGPKSVVVSIVLALCLIQRARSSYLLEIQAHRYENSDHELANGQCCDNEGASSDCLAFLNTIACGFFYCECDIRFFFCLRDSGTSRDDDIENCPRGSYETGQVSTDSDEFDFSSPIADGVPNPMTFDGDVWPVSLQEPC